MKHFLKLIVGLALCLNEATEAQPSAHAEWKAQWINTEQCQSATNTWLIYRKRAEVASVPKQVIARIAADTKYWLWINDKMVVLPQPLGPISATNSPLFISKQSLSTATVSDVSV